MAWLSLGTSDEVTSDQIDEIINILEKDYKNLYLICWHGMANSYDIWFYEDQVHSNPTRQPYHVYYVAKTIVDHIFN
jgi:hypothetical protein